MTETFQTAPGEEGFLARHGLTSVEAMFRSQAGRQLSKSGLEGWRQRWCLRLTDELGGARTVYMKRFQQPPFRRQWERWREGHPTRSTAGVEWDNACVLAAAGVPAVRALACGQEMVGPWERRSCLLLAEVPGESLERWLPAHLAPAAQEADLPRRRRLLTSAITLLAGFHGAGWVHRDLYLSHLFIEGEVLRLIDLQRVFRPRWRRRRWVVKDLAALHFSTPADRVGRFERMRFLCAYARRCQQFGDARTLARLVDAKARRMAGRRPALAVGVTAQSHREAAATISIRNQDSPAS